MNDALSLNHLTIQLSGHTVLSDISLTIAANRFVGVLGPNGAGKSTLMRAILGLVRPSGGTISVLGADVAAGNARIGYMPQVRTTNLSLPLRGYDFVASAVEGHRWGIFWPTRKVRAEVQWALDLVEGSGLADRPLRDLSGGERQRLLLAQALIGRPQLLLLDEPLAGLDPRHQQAVVRLVGQIRKELAATVLFSAHDINPLLGALDEVLYLGRSHAVLGPVESVVTGPVLSRLYGTSIDVIRHRERIFVMAGNTAAEEADHVHDA
ncbi:MAG: ABC transporter ATP-binding protein [Castellaniella sp.]|uniref:metal ABC transporter ATP-binding protein n=1 Tax=Castellaniella sp. TaxID=1955812 RepID=UPI001225A477|nr:ABC transporter ATP-binding protein [Castellaniella sp.]TAN31137.1 MAG: ABC transporter ATP-binding protein [Castellaniella sp.]